MKEDVNFRPMSLLRTKGKICTRIWERKTRKLDSVAIRVVTFTRIVAAGV